LLWHLITGEYPPQPGGVSDYTRLIARELVRAGDDVHVWTSHERHPAPDDAGVVVHRLPDRFGPNGLRVLDAELRTFDAKGRVLVQYVPHMYGYRAMNVAFATWLRLRAPRYWVMFHEVTFPILRQQKWTHNILGGVNHVMATLIAGAAERIFVSVPTWATLLRARCFVRRDVEWLPVPSNLPTEVDANSVRRLRSELLSNSDGLLLGHFGTFHERIGAFLSDVVPRVLRRDDRSRALMLGRGSDAFVRALSERSPDVRARIIARADLPGRDVAEHLASCDLLMQPYLDGVSSRRGSAMAGLALGRPIVTNRGAATEPLWTDEALVAAVAMDDRTGFVERVESLLASPDERAQLGERGRLGYEAHFSCERTIAALRGQVRG
jgi:glycosyltransferase involved in cell wall biosynthesis